MKKFNYLIILFISLVLGWQLLRPGYYSMHDDLQVMRLFEMNRCFENGQIPCRWVPDLGQNYGQPLFNYYSALPYYLGQVFHLVGFTYIDTVKLLFLMSLFLSGVFVYWLTREFMKETTALVAAIAYLTTPYHAVDIFVRGALSESWGLTLVPLVLYSLIRVCRQPRATNSVIFALSLAALLTTHNITVLISFPILVIFGAYFFLTSPKKKSQTFYLIPGVMFGIGLSAFFLFPVLFEQSFIQTKFLTSDYFDFRAHFVTIGQLFTKLTWGYGPSRFNSFQYPQTLSFFVGILPVISILISPVLLWIRRRDRQLFPLIIITFTLSFLTLFMTHSRSLPIWESVKPLNFVQFPWRFLGPVSLLTSILIGFAIDVIKVEGRQLTQIASFLIAFLITANFSNFRFEKYFPNETDRQKLSGEAYDSQIRGALLDYLPSSVKVIPNSKALANPQVLSGIVETNYFDKRSNYFSSEFDIRSDTAEIRFPIMDFPGWTVYQNRSGTPVKFDANNDYGQITVKLTKGHQLIQAFFENTPLRGVSNAITFISGFLLTLLLVLDQRRPDEK
ncbi:hypothetical protein HYU91_02105 [Candidatus Collierbacteria bacterium]|nr:hypothetical protein [Candidatus Collierbacteria bacterium]